eukprot:c53140_g1_i1.p1 GENE.c53140_g1_i1~~c53140_g1_i1.p1  ORF type:complete len:107 (-),score=6.32 c53140_g1_i1:148-468(-)
MAAAAATHAQRVTLVLRALDRLSRGVTANSLFHVLPREAFPTRRVVRDEVLRATTAEGLTLRSYHVLPVVPKRPRKMHRRNPHYIYNVNRDNEGTISLRRCAGVVV